MNGKIEKWLKLSVSDVNDEKSRNVVLIRTSLRVCIFLIIIIVAGDFIGGGKTPKITLLVDGIMLLVSLGLLYFLSKGKVSLAGTGLVIFGIILISAAIYTLGTIRAPSTSAYLLIIIIAGMLFDIKGLIYSVTVISLILFGLFWAESNGLLRQPNFGVTITQWITYTSIFFMCGLLSIFVIKTLHKALANLNQEIFERTKLEENLKASLEEKETLLHETHHRVKNNMQVINSLLQLQSNAIEDNTIKEILKDSRSRVYAMAAVHETLHGSEKLSEIDLKNYLSKITTSIFQSYAADHSKVKLNSNVENSPINLNQAYPLGLIINELISNALKYAFPDNREGEIKVSVKKQDKELDLTIIDNGVGMPEDVDWKNTNTLGLKLVSTLVENQLDGSIDMESKNGTKFAIKFNIEA
jgi:two-component sensor histidine kinase